MKGEARAEAGKRMSPSQGLGQGKPGAETKASEAHRHVGEKRADAAEEMRHAGHVEPQPIRRRRH